MSSDPGPDPETAGRRGGGRGRRRARAGVGRGLGANQGALNDADPAREPPERPIAGAPRLPCPVPLRRAKPGDDRRAPARPTVGAGRGIRARGRDAQGRRPAGRPAPSPGRPPDDQPYIDDPVSKMVGRRHDRRVRPDPGVRAAVRARRAADPRADAGAHPADRPRRLAHQRDRALSGSVSATASPSAAPPWPTSCAARSVPRRWLARPASACRPRSPQQPCVGRGIRPVGCARRAAPTQRHPTAVPTAGANRGPNSCRRRRGATALPTLRPQRSPTVGPPWPRRHRRPRRPTAAPTVAAIRSARP